MSTTYTTRYGDMLDAICWQHYGRHAGAVEEVLRANPGLAALSPILPSGHVITLPELDEPDVESYVRLWE